MTKRASYDPNDKSGGQELTEMPPGVKLLRSLEGHTNVVTSVAFDPQSGMLASGSTDNTVKLWDARSGKLLRTLEGHGNSVYNLAFNPLGDTLASGSTDNTVKLWDARSGKLLHTLEHGDWVWSVAFDPQGRTLASGSDDCTVKLWEPRSGKLLRTIETQLVRFVSVAFDRKGDMLASGTRDDTLKLWDARSGKLLRTLEGHGEIVLSVAFDLLGGMLASGSADNTVKLWDARSGKLLRTLEGHTAPVEIVAFSPDGYVLASRSKDRTVRLWICETWETVAVIPEQTNTNYWITALAFHPTLPFLAAAGSEPDTPQDEQLRLIHLYELDYDVLLGKPAGVAVPPRAVHHTTGKIVLVGDHSVGKSALGHRLIHGCFEKQESTHGQQFWVFPALGKRRADGTECEAILWDFAGQPDYRLVHALFVDDADLALVLFDASDIRDPLHGVEFWIKQLQIGRSACPMILVAAQTDRGTCSMTPEELKAYCLRHEIKGPMHTSALTGDGVQKLIEQMKAMIPWEDKPATVTTTTFKRIKDYVLGLKEKETDGQSIVTPDELRRRLEGTDPEWKFTDAEMLTAVGHLENYGYIKKLRTSRGEECVLLAPELLNNLASSFVLEARRNPKGLGSLDEKRLLSGDYSFSELTTLTEAECDVLLDAAALLFLEHNVCFRETDPLSMKSYLVFPELINLKKPIEEDKVTEEGVAYTVSGPTENVFASLVVLLGYTQTFTRTNQWKNNARYEVGEGLVCGFRQEGERDGELDFVICFYPEVGQPVRTLFQGLFESFLARRNLTVMRYEPVRCTNEECAHLLDRTVVRQRMKEDKDFAFCNECGEKLALPKMAEPIQLTRDVEAEVDAQRSMAEQRTRFEQAVFRVQAYVAEQDIKPSECFISYAWGEAQHERWVERQLSTDLQKAGIDVVLDRWENAKIGASIPRFVERVATCDRVVVVGTPLYRHKYDNDEPMGGYVVAAEGDLIGKRMIGKEKKKDTVLPVLLAGAEEKSFPPLLHGRVYADFRNEKTYFATAFDLILSLYDIDFRDQAVADLRDSLRGPEF